jgi:hypothetical protein
MNAGGFTNGGFDAMTIYASDNLRLHIRKWFVPRH